MHSRTGWYARGAAIWTVALAAGCGISYLLFQLPWHPLILSMLLTALWSTLGSLMAGPWSYRSYLEPHGVPWG